MPASNSTAPAGVPPTLDRAAQLSDDEILGISTRAPSPRTTHTGRHGHAANVAAKHSVPAGRPAPQAVGPLDDMLNELMEETSAGDEVAAESGAGQPNGQDADDAEPGEAAAHSATAEELQAIFARHPDLERACKDELAYREAYATPEAAREMQKLFPTIEDARAAQQQLGELGRLDALFFANRPEAHAELAAAVYRLDPAAFASLARIMNGILSQSSRNNASASPLAKADAPAVFPSNERDLAEAPATPARGAQAPEAARAAQFSSFYEDANAIAVQNVVDSIEAQVERLLPEGVAPGARQRVVGEIYREVDARLQSNPALAAQVRQVFRNGRLDAAHQRAVVNLIVSRARQALPAAAKKVIAEWTTGVVAAHEQRRNRQRAAERRVDVTGPGHGASGGRRPLSPADIDYARLNDSQILDL